MSDESAAEKTLDPTPQRLEKAREKGDLVKSADLSTFASYVGFLLAMVLFTVGLPDIFNALAATWAFSYDLAYTADPSALLLFNGLKITLLVVAAPAAAVVIALIVQRVFVFTPSKLHFKLNRISPLSQAKNKFGSQGLVEFAKSFGKVCSYLAVWVFIAPSRQSDLAASAGLPPLVGFSWGADVVQQLIIVVAVMTLVFAAADYLWQRFSFMKRNRMTRQEFTDENKESEGDPHFKQQRRQRATAIAMHQIAQEVPKASVVVVNPTHYAVALAWDAKSRRAPVCVAKGVDEMAAQIRRLAQEHGVPIQSDPPTARALYAHVAVGQEVGRAHYKAVAAAIRFAQAMREKAR